MSSIEANLNKYTKAWRLASYLEAEWSDFLLENSSNQLANESEDSLANYVQLWHFQPLLPTRARVLPRKFI